MQSINRFIPLLLFLTICCFALNAQTPTTCVASAVPAIMHAEGLAEQVGTINLQCTGTPGAVVSGSLGISLPIAITNRINSGSYAVDATLSVATNTGTTPTGVAGLVSNQSITFNGFHFTVPSNGTFSLIVNDIRANANQLGLQQQQMPIQAFLTSSLLLMNSTVQVGISQIGLLATQLDSAVTCTGSPSPGTVSVANLISTGTAEQSTRITEGFADSFQPKDATSDTGTRFLLSYAGLPSGATIYVPDAIAGSTATTP